MIRTIFFGRFPRRRSLSPAEECVPQLADRGRIRSLSSGIYPCRTLGGHHDHRHLDRTCCSRRCRQRGKRPAGCSARTTSNNLPWQCRTTNTRPVIFASGGWGWVWQGDPDRGNGKNQPGGWIFNILPYLEQLPLYRTWQRRSPRYMDFHPVSRLCTKNTNAPGSNQLSLKKTVDPLSL